MSEVGNTPVISHARDRMGILYVSPQPSEVFEGMDVGRDDQWIRRALGGTIGPDQLTVVRVCEEPLPDTIEASGIIIGGSKHSVNDDEPWIEDLRQFALAAHQREVPMLGICFGHQLIASALGGEVIKNPKGLEFGINKVKLTPAGEIDDLFEGMPHEFYAAQSHSDVVMARRSGALVLASNIYTSNQALGYGKSTHGVQFHPEIGPAELTAIARVRQEQLMAVTRLDSDGFDHFVESFQAHKTDASQRVLTNFVEHFVAPRMAA